MIVFFLAGAGCFSYLISQLGLSAIREHIGRAGWSLSAVILIWFVIYLLNTLSWKIVLGDAARGLSFPRLFMVTVSGFVMNYVTPIVAIGGEPYKVKVLASSLGAERSLSAVILYRMVHLLGHMLLLATGIVGVLFVLELPRFIILSLVAALFVVGATILVTLMGHRDGIFKPLRRLLGKSRILLPLGQRLDKYSHQLAEMDIIVTHVYHNDRALFYLAITLEYVSRLLMGLEVYVLLLGVGVEVGLMASIFLYVLYSIIINLFFFVPLNLGAREGGLYLGMEALTLTPLLGVYLGIVMRLREFFWIVVGLLFMLVSMRQESHLPPADQIKERS